MPERAEKGHDGARAEDARGEDLELACKLEAVGGAESASGAELDRKDALGRTPKALAYDFNQRELYDFLAQAEGPEKRPSSIFA